MSGAMLLSANGGITGGPEQGISAVRLWDLCPEGGKAPEEGCCNIWVEADRLSALSP